MQGSTSEICEGECSTTYHVTVAHGDTALSLNLLKEIKE
jgi:hypothetical protein